MVSACPYVSSLCAAAATGKTRLTTCYHVPLHVAGGRPMSCTNDLHQGPPLVLASQCMQPQPAMLHQTPMSGSHRSDKTSSDNGLMHQHVSLGPLSGEMSRKVLNAGAQLRMLAFCLASKASSHEEVLGVWSRHHNGTLLCHISHAQQEHLRPLYMSCAHKHF